MMMRRSDITYAVLFVAAMIGAAVSWTREPVEDEAEGMVLLDVETDAVAEVRYESKELDVVLQGKSDEFGEYLWVQTERTIDKKTPQNPHDPHVVMDKETTEVEKKGDVELKSAAFKAGKTADQLLKDLAPLRVLRPLEVSEDKLSDFGLSEPEAKLVIKTKNGKERTLSLGDAAYGFKNRYVRDDSTGAVYVAKNAVFSPLKRADTTLQDKQLFAFERKDVDRVTVKTANESSQFVQQNREDPSAAAWTAPGSKEPNASADTWLDKIFRLRSSGHVVGDAGAGAELVFALELVPGDGKPVVLEVLRGQAADGAPQWYARSQYTRGVVKLDGNLASDAADDLGAVLGGAPGP